MSKSKKIILAFYGITRSLHHTHQSIDKNIIQPAKYAGRVLVYCHFFKQETIDNPRTAEKGLLDPNEWRLLRPDIAIIEEIDSTVENEYISQLKNYGNAWEDSGESLRNIIRQLISLHKITEKIQEDGGADLIVFLRPDMCFHDAFPFETLIQTTKPYTVIVPEWQWSGGLNDRYTICGRDSYKIIGKRITQATSYCQKYKKPLHSERLLFYSIKNSFLHLQTTSIRATRIRFTGKASIESFEPAKLAKRIEAFLLCNIWTFFQRIQKIIKTQFTRENYL